MEASLPLASPDAVSWNEVVVLSCGDVLGTPASVNKTDAFSFIAQEIGSFSDGGTVFKLKAGAGNDNLPVGATGDVTLLEVS